MSTIVNGMTGNVNMIELMQYQARRAWNADIITGTILTRPELLYGDAVSLTYACDVDVGLTGIDVNTASQTTIPLRNVPIAQGAQDVRYADVGMAVTLQKTTNGLYQIVGFAKTKTGTYHRVPVCLSRNDVGTPINISLSARPFTLGELQSYGGGFGVIPFGAYGIFQGGTLLEIRS